MNKPIQQGLGLAVTQGHIEINGRKICVRSWGSPGQPSVVLLHGFQSHAALWDQLGTNLAEQGYHVIAPDRRGHGLSDWYETYSVFDYVHDLRELFVHYELQSSILVGHCESTFIAGLYAHAFPDEIRRLCLLQYPDVSRKINAKTQAELVKIFMRRESGLEVPPLAVFKNPDEATEALLRNAPFRIPPTMARRITPRNVRDVDGGVSWRWDPRLLQYRLLMDTIDLDLFVNSIAGLQMPVELIYGNESSLMTGQREKLLNFAAKRMPRARCTLVPGGHYPHMEDKISHELLEIIAL